MGPPAEVVTEVTVRSPLRSPLGHPWVAPIPIPGFATRVTPNPPWWSIGYRGPGCPRI